MAQVWGTDNADDLIDPRNYGKSSIFHVYGLGGDDTLRGGGCADTLDGGTETDTADYSASDAAVNVDLSRTGAQFGGHAEGDTLSGIENVVGSVFADSIVGHNLLNGGALAGATTPWTVAGATTPWTVAAATTPWTVAGATTPCWAARAHSDIGGGYNMLEKVSLFMDEESCGNLSGALAGIMGKMRAHLGV